MGIVRASIPLTHDRLDAIEQPLHIERIDGVARTEADSYMSRDTARERSVALALDIGVMVGRFAIVSELGRGGMGVVYLGHDPKLERHAAIKVVRTGGPVARARMLREAQALARVSHPNVVHVYEVDEHGHDVYVAMEFVDGVSLRDWLAAAVREPEDICQRFIAAGRGLAAVHAAGLIHRDFKPDNVMVGHDGRVRVLDFGLAADSGFEADAPRASSTAPRSDRHSDAFAEVLTTTGVRLGTPAYMAPEQHQGGVVDVRTDQFSLCVSLWEALYGERPFQGDTMLALSSSVTRGELPIPTRAERLPEVHAVIARGLAVDPDDRWPTVDALLAALEDGLSAHVAPQPRSRVALRDPNHVVLALVFGLFNGAVGMHFAAYLGIVLSTLSTIAVFYAAQVLRAAQQQASERKP